MNCLKRSALIDKSIFIKENKTMSLVVFGITGIIASFLKLLPDQNSEILFILQFIILIFGLLYFYFLGKESSVLQAKDEFKEYIDNDRNLKLLVSNIFYNQIETNKSRITDAEYISILKKWHKASDEKNNMKHIFIRRQNVQSFINDIGLEDFGNLLLTKCEKNGLMKVKNNNNELLIQLSLINCKPNLSFFRYSNKINPYATYLKK